MRTALYFGRICLRQRPRRLIFDFIRHERQYSVHPRWPISWRRPPKPPGTKTIAFSLLSPAAFVALSEEENGDGKTPEEHMLEASRAEIAKEIPDDAYGVNRIWKALYLGVDLYIWEPIATTFRFLHLFVIFIPVLASVPVIWIGGRQRDKDDERSGTMWWYSLLVHSMERAGPAFIKVLVYEQKLPIPWLTLSLVRPVGCFTNRYIPSADVQHHVASTLECPSTLIEAHQTKHSPSV